MYGSDAATHDFIVQRGGIHDKVLRGLGNLLTARDRTDARTKVEIRSLVCKVNLGQLPEIVAGVTRRFGVLDWFGVLGLQLSVRPLLHAQACELTLGTAQGTIRSGIDEALGLGWRVCVSGLPICIIGLERAAQIASATRYHQRAGPGGNGGRATARLAMFPQKVYYPNMTRPEQGIDRAQSSKIKGRRCHLCRHFAECSGVDRRYGLHMGLDDLIPITASPPPMNTAVDADREGTSFSVIEREKIRYAEDGFAKDYLGWGFDPPDAKAREVAFVLEKLDPAPGSAS